MVKISAPPEVLSGCDDGVGGGALLLELVKGFGATLLVPDLDTKGLRGTGRSSACRWLCGQTYIPKEQIAPQRNPLAAETWYLIRIWNISGNKA